MGREGQGEPRDYGCRPKPVQTATWRVTPLRLSFRRSKRELDRITSKQDLEEVLDLLEALEDDPFPPYARLLAETDSLWSFDFGDREYRAVYQVSAKQRRVILKVIHNLEPFVPITR
jgi:mRNA-degrading endonuclease RelE of RelBE toxin-antitoxin system